MATVVPYLSHLERTAAEPRDDGLRNISITRIDQVNSKIRLFQLQPSPLESPVKFYPGQWLDVYVPGIPRAGGFTITSTPSTPYVELAIQKSPSNPPAAWLWRDEGDILGKQLQVRAGGSFIWPPRGRFKRVVFMAGGVGINPLISMVSAVAEAKNAVGKLGFQVEFLYSTKLPDDAIDAPDKDMGLSGILFLSRLLAIAKEMSEEMKLRLFLTSTQKDLRGLQSAGDGFEEVPVEGETVQLSRRRIGEQDILQALGPVGERSQTVCYICGVPGMTDELVEKVRKTEGMLESNVLFEKWW